MRTSAASRRLRLHLALLLSLTAFLSGCAAKSAGEDAVAHFHALYNAGKSHEIYELIKEEDTSGTTERAMFEKVDFFRSTVGNVQSSELTDFYQQEFFVDEPRVKLTYRTKFDSGAGTETFWFHILKGHTVLLNWQVDSPEAWERIKQMNRPPS